MSILSWLAIGTLCGVVTGLLASRHGVLEDIILGIVGAIVGGWVFTTLSGSPVTGFSFAAAVVAAAGSALFLLLARGLTHGRTTL